MARKETTFDGMADGGSIGAGALATGSGDPPSLVTKGAGSFMIAVSTPTAFGVRAARLDLAVNQTTRIEDVGTGSGAYVQACIRFPALPPSGESVEVLRIFNGTNRNAYMMVTSSGTVQILDSANAVIWTSGSTIPTGAYVRYDLYAKENASTAAGSISGGFSTTLTAALATPVTTTTGGSAYARTDQNASTVAPTGVYAGKCNTTSTLAGTGAMFMDNFARDFGVSAVGAPPATDVAPTATLTASTLYPQAGDTITLTGGGTGTITTRSHLATLIPVGGSSPVYAAPGSAVTTVTVPDAGQYVFQLINTGPGGDSAPAAVRVYVHPAAGDDGFAFADTGSTAWTTFGTAGSMKAGVNDSSPLTGAESPVNPTGTETKRWTMFPVGLGPIEFDHSGYSNGGSLSSRVWTMFKEDGTTTVDQWTVVPVPNVDTQVPGLSVDSAGLALLTGVNDLATLGLRRALILEVKSAV